MPGACKSSDGRFSVSRLIALVLLIFAGLYTAGALAGETGAQLSFFQSRNGKTAWMIWSAAANRTDVFMEVADAPSLVLWESKPGAVLFVSGKSIFQAEMEQTPARRKQVAALPEGHGDVRTIWRDAASSRLRVAAMLPIEESDVLDETDDEISIWRPGPGLRSILFGTIMGDAPHAAPTVIILSPDEKSGQSLPLDEHVRQVMMGIADGLLLVADESQGAHPIVVDLKTGQVRWSWPEATGAVWVPTPSMP